MLPRLQVTVPSFSADEWKELDERIQALENFSEKLTINCILLQLNTERNDKKIKFLSQWLCSLSDSNCKLKQLINETKVKVTEQEFLIEKLTFDFNKLKLN